MPHESQNHRLNSAIDSDQKLRSVEAVLHLPVLGVSGSLAANIAQPTETEQQEV
jgi:hypothetical protein